MELISLSSTVYYVQPVVLFSILDHHKRRRSDQKAAIGILLGEVINDEVWIKNSFGIVYKDEGESVECDLESVKQTLELFRKLNPNYIVIGWYCSSNKINYITSCLHDAFTKLSQVDDTLLLTVDTNFKDYRLAVRGHTLKQVIVNEQPLVSRFEPARVQITSHEAEKIGVDTILSGVPDQNEADRLDAPASILTDYENLEHSLTILQENIEIVSQYVQQVVEGKIEGDEEIGRAISQALSSIPRLDVALFDKTFSNSMQDLLMILYLSNFAKSQMALAEKISGLYL